jgi:hypothetical protein
MIIKFINKLIRFYINKNYNELKTTNLVKALLKKIINQVRTHFLRRSMIENHRNHFKKVIKKINTFYFLCFSILIYRN